MYIFDRFYPNGKKSADTLNTVEHIQINPAGSGVWKVRLYHSFH